MGDRRKICIVTGTRAEYGLLRPLMRLLANDSDFQLMIVATNMHLSPEFGLTYKTIEKDGFNIDRKVEMLLSGDTPVSVTKSMGLAVIGFADAFADLCPDAIVLLGDRYEILAAAQASLVAKIPVIHIIGGDSTEGCFDDTIRHSITKMSHLHFVTNEMSLQRVLQLGENPTHVFNVGHLGLDVIRETRLMSLKELEADLRFSFREQNLLVTFHPVTLEANSASEHFANLLTVLGELGDRFGIFFTFPNSDPGGRAFMTMIDEFIENHANSRGFVSLGQTRYLSLMSQVNAVVGNSSSGIYEAPSFKIPTLNIGDRQKGRLQSPSVVNCSGDSFSIRVGLQKAFSLNCSTVVNPYGDGHTAPLIIKKLKDFRDFKSLLKKSFYSV